MLTAIGSGGGGGGGGPVIAIVPVTDLVVSVNEVAVTVTAPSLGIVAGAVYVVTLGAPKLSSVIDGLNDPHAVAPHVTVQITPAPTGSLVGVAERRAVVLTSTELGTARSKPIAIGVGRIVRLTLLLCEGLLVTVAVMVTEAPIGTAGGAVKTVAAPSAVWAGVSVPHTPFVILPVTGFPPQVTAQSTPALMASPVGSMLSFVV